jgi:hypothetical protein
MNPQIDIFSPPLKELSRTGDPETSKAAAKAMKESGKLSRHEAEIIWLIKRFPFGDFTAKGLARWADNHTASELDFTQINKRIAYIRRKGLITKTGEVRQGCAVYRVVKGGNDGILERC